MTVSFRFGLLDGFGDPSRQIVTVNAMDAEPRAPVEQHKGFLEASENLIAWRYYRHSNLPVLP